MSGIGSSDDYGATCGTFLTLYETAAMSGSFFLFHDFFDLVFMNSPEDSLLPYRGSMTTSDAFHSEMMELLSVSQLHRNCVYYKSSDKNKRPLKRYIFHDYSPKKGNQPLFMKKYDHHESDLSY